MLQLVSTLTNGSALFLAFLVLSIQRNANVLANRWLGAFLLMLAFFMLDESFFNAGIYQTCPQLIGLPSLFIFALSPTLYLCVSHFVSIEKRFQALDLLHFTPTGLFVMFSLPLLFAPDAAKLAAIDIPSEKLNPADLIFLSIWVFQLIIYWVLCFQKLRKHRRRMEEITATPDEVRLDWLRNFLIGIGVIIVVLVIDLVFIPVNHPEGSWIDPFYFILIYFLGYFALQQREVFPFAFQEVAGIRQILAEQDTPTHVPKRRLFSEDTLAQLKQQLIMLMEQEKPYRDNELSLPTLARQMRLGTHELSHLINEGFGENFSQFINRYRVEESKNLLRSPKYAHLNMVGIAYEAGFNSKTAFYTAFKKITGVSPTTYQDELGQHPDR